MKKYKVTLNKEEREYLLSISKKGNHRSQKILNALILLNYDEGKYQTKRVKNEDISKVLKISMKKICSGPQKTRQNYAAFLREFCRINSLGLNPFSAVRSIQWK